MIKEYLRCLPFYVNEGREKECDGLPRACLCDAYQVQALQRNGPSLHLE